jgi:predicted cupin superfamily sugar epimerase/mannose-6-phosphate isomerase-like protein (cupin superfamily)
MAGRLIAHYKMKRIPQEGPWFSLTYESNDMLGGADLPERYAGRAHLAGSAVMIVETSVDFSAMHRLRTDEVWHFYGGSPIDMLLLYPDGTGRRITLGGDVLSGQWPQFTVPHGVWQGSMPRNRAKTYSLAGDQLSPGFDYADFEMGYRDALQREYRAFAADIRRLTRDEFATAPLARPAMPTVESSRVIVFPSSGVPIQTMAAGVQLQELVGKVAPNAKSGRVSVAQFVLEPGRSSGMSFNHRSQEVFWVASGSGRVHLASEVLPVSPGSVVFIPPGAVHAIEADANSTLTFLAISAPAFTPEDYAPAGQSPSVNGSFDLPGEIPASGDLRSIRQDR